MLYVPKNIKIIVVDGNIGAGKSTLISDIKKITENENYSGPIVCCIFEPILDFATTVTEDNGGKSLLEKFYEDPKQYAFIFQIKAILSRITQFQIQVTNFINQHGVNDDKDKKREEYQEEEEEEPIYVIIDRSIYGDKILFQNLYENGCATKDEWETYLFLFGLAEPIIRQYANFVYVNTDVNKCKERIDKRNRAGEKDITIDYLENIHQRHLRFIEDIKNDKQRKDRLLEVSWKDYESEVERGIHSNTILQDMIHIASTSKLTNI